MPRPVSWPVQGLLGREGVRLLHAYDLDVRILQERDRQDLVGRIEDFLQGVGAATTNFRFAEFRDDQGRRLLVVEEDC